MLKEHASLQSGEQVLQSVCAAQVLEPFSSVPETIALNEYLLFHHLLQKNVYSGREIMEQIRERFNLLKQVVVRR
jgi:hypothetical protein